MGKLDALRNGKHVIGAQKPTSGAEINDSDKIAISGTGEEYESEMKNIALDSIDFHESNIYNVVESDPEDIARLAEDIRLNGLMHNPVVTQRPGSKRFVLLSGERRIKAVRYLLEEAKRSNDLLEMGKYLTVSCKVIKIEAENLEERRKKEEIYLDSANLQVRGSIGDSGLLQTVTVRYITNVMTVYGLSETDAKNLLKEVTGHASDRTIDRNMQLYRNLLPELYELYNSEQGELSKSEIIKVASLDRQEQRMVLGAFQTLADSRDVLGEKYHYLVEKLRQRTDTLTDGSRDERTAQLAEMQKLAAEAVRQAAAQQPPLHTEQPVLDVYSKKRMLYLGTLEKNISAIQKLGKKSAVKQIRGLEKMAGPEDESILEKLNELQQAIEELRDKIRESV